ncbi:hypothetical protein E2F43_04035 [Seongchinamella unica]|uniref:Glycosyltransferase RgtA/B/C/D-like domain-containing protein n=1 Tax=Seongchinamella unica TaxID=2547392 RepID=A0A4R5LVD9_9GAMM|nr:hypothetical protein [Seongchinamella unica]TDG15409.1 hypothetical protein E2F43_04035 [Seongchinamella unica]
MTHPLAEPRYLLLLLFVAGCVLYLSFGYTEMAGSDLWWHIAAGREILQTGSPRLVDDWSFSANGADWLNHEWLADIIYYQWVSVFGLTSLVYWKWLLIVVTFGVLQYVLYRQTGSALAAFICAGMAAAMAAPFLDVRPHLYTLLFFSVLLGLACGRQVSRWVLAVLFVVWVNLHGGFFFGLMALAILVFPWRHLSLDQFRPAFITGALCVAACLLNPSGFETLLFPLVYAFDDSSPYRELAEWHSPFREGGIRSPLFFVLMWAPLLALAYTVKKVRRRTGLPWEGLLLTGLTLAMALTSRRFIPLFGMSLALMLAPLLALLMSAIRKPALRYTLAVVALLAAVVRLLPYPLQAAPAFHYLTAEYSYPQDMVDFIEANNFKGRVYALYNWGGYLHWRTDGELKVFIDGRADTVYDADTYYHYIGVLAGRPGWIDAVEATGAQFVLWPYGQRNGQQKLEALRATGRWRALYQDSVSWLAARTSVELPSKPTFPPPSPLRELSRATTLARNGQGHESLQAVQNVRRKLPWQKNACQLEINLHRAFNDATSAQRVLDECLGYFPTRLLR